MAIALILILHLDLFVQQMVTLLQNMLDGEQP